MKMVWTIQNNLNGQVFFDSGKKFCPTSAKVQNCNIGSFLKEGKKGLNVLKKNKTKWHECRDLCNKEDNCDYFKWKVHMTYETLIIINKECLRLLYIYSFNEK